MTLKEQTQQIQKIIGVEQTGIFDDYTACKTIKKLKFSLPELTTIIQKKVNALPDSIYGPNTAREILKRLDAEIPADQPISNLQSEQFKEVYRQTPNISSSSIKPIGCVLHHSCGSYDGTVSWILQKRSQVSYHVLINKDGNRTVFAKDTQRTWHAGKSNFNGRTDCNSFMVGLSFTHDTNTRELTQQEVDSCVEWLLPRFAKWGWPKDLSTITTHRYISPGRKDDVDIRAEERIVKALQVKL